MRVALTTCRQFILRDKQSLFSLGAANYTVESHVTMCALMICLRALLKQWDIVWLQSAYGLTSE